MRLALVALACTSLLACGQVLGLDDFGDQPSGAGAAGASGGAGSTASNGGSGVGAGGSGASSGGSAAGGGPPSYSAKAVTAGAQHSCALLTGGSVVCWGNNDDGQLGDGSFASSPSPVEVSGIASAISIHAGGRHTCALLQGGSVLCWGDNEEGQIGSLAGTDAPEPVEPDGLPPGIGGVSAGGAHTCAFETAGQAHCWGNNTWGQLGRGNLGGASSVAPVLVLSVVLSVAAGAGHSCAAADTAVIWCWGDNAQMQVGGPESLYPQPRSVGFVGSPGPPNSGSPVVAARDSSCNLRLDAPWCWGRNDLGQLGIGNTIPSGQAVNTGLTNVVQIDGGGDHFCARQQNGTLLCWGSNDRGQLGDGTSGSFSSSPVPVAGLGSAVDVGAGLSHTCAVVERMRGSPEVYCWGANESGQLGDGSTDPSNSPVSVQSLP